MRGRSDIIEDGLESIFKLVLGFSLVIKYFCDMARHLSFHIPPQITTITL